MEVSHNGNCRYELSHFTVAVPCGEVSNISNSAGWPIELTHPDPTTGLVGFKVDDVKDFGKDPRKQSFTVSFTLCASEQACKESLACWKPLVAYKSGQCVDYDTVRAACSTTQSTLNESANSFEKSVELDAYPNPFQDVATIAFTLPESDKVNISLYSLDGTKVKTLFEGRVMAKEAAKVTFDARDLPDNLYIYKLTTSKTTFVERIMLAR